MGERPEGIISLRAKSVAGITRPDRGRSGVSLNNWTDFFGSSLDLTSNVLTVFDQINIEEEPSAEDFDSGSEDNSARVDQSRLVNGGRDLGVTEEESEVETDDYEDLFDPTDVVVLTNRKRSLVGTLPAKPKPKLHSPQHTKKDTADFLARGSQTLPSRSKQARLAPSHRVVPCEDPVNLTPLVDTGTLRSDDSGYQSEVHNCTADKKRMSPQDDLPLPPLPPDAAGNVVHEIIVTERGYVHDLETLVEGYVHPMMSSGVFDPSEVSTIFCNLESLCSTHRRLLAKLEKSTCDMRSMSQAFQDCYTEFQSYANYCTNFPRSLVRLEEILNDSSKQHFLAARQKQLCLSLPLQAYLLKPVQRILKYHLLLMSLHKVLPESEAVHVKPAMECMTRIASNINEVQRRHEHALRVQELKSLLKSAHLDITSLGELVREDTFRIHGHKGTRQVFLFHKAILLTKRLENGFLVIKEIILCANLMLIEAIPKEPLSFHILPFDNPKCQQTLQARKMEQKKLWCQDIKCLILENYEATIPEKAKQIVMNMSEFIHNATTIEKGRDLGKRRNTSAREIKVSAPEMLSPNLRRNQSEDCGLDVPHHSRPLSRCYSSTEDLNDLLKYHEETLIQTFARQSSRHDSSSRSSSTTDTDSESSRPADIVDFTSIAIEINEEVLGFGTSPKQRSMPAPGTGHRRQPSCGRASDILRATIDNSLKKSISPVHAHKGESAKKPPVHSNNGASATPLYIDMGKANYDTMVFGRAYEVYIEKTKKNIMLTENDIDEILKPLRQLHVDCTPPEPATTQNKPGSLGSHSPTPPSSADSSPCRIVSRIATSSNCVNAASTPTKVIRVDKTLQETSSQNGSSHHLPAVAEKQRSQSVVSAMFGEIKSAFSIKKSSRSNSTVITKRKEEPPPPPAPLELADLPVATNVRKFIQNYASNDMRAKYEEDVIHGAVQPPSVQRSVPTQRRQCKAKAPSPPSPRQQNGKGHHNHPLPTPPTLRPRVQVKDVIDSIPFADEDERRPPAAPCSEGGASVKEWRKTGDWSSENIYWKRALLDPPKKPPPPPGVTQHSLPARTAPLVKQPSTRGRAPPPPVPSAPIANGEARCEEEEEVEERPRRGTVASLVNRFQKP